MNNQPAPAQSDADGEIPRKVRAALSDPLALSHIASQLDPLAICQGNMQKPIEKAAALILVAGLYCNETSGDSLAEVAIKLAEHFSDYKGMMILLANLYSPKVEPDVLVLSEDVDKDTLRPFLRDHANFEVKDAKGKREAWKTTRMVSDNLLLWFISRANDHNLRFAGENWRDGQAEFEKAMDVWAKDGDWHIPRTALIAADRNTDLQGSSTLPSPPDWQFIPWRHLMKGRFKEIRQMTRAEDQTAHRKIRTPIKKKLSESGRNI